MLQNRLYLYQQKIRGAMSKIIVIQHSPFEPLGIMVNTLRQMKMRLRYVNFHREPVKRLNLDGYSGLVILGGNLNPDQLGSVRHLSYEVELIQQAIEREMPVLGICLGSQLLNIALGGKCYRLTTPEYGWVDVNKQDNDNQIFKGFNVQEKVFQWHQYACETPSHVQTVLENESCVQAFCYQEKYIGLQFHLEVDAKLLDRWLKHPDYLTHLRANINEEQIAQMHYDTTCCLPNSLHKGQQFFESFCLLFQKKSRSMQSMHAGR